MRGETNLVNNVAEILRKSMREEREMVWWKERKTIEFQWCSYRNSYPKCKLPKLEECRKKERKKKKNYDNGVAEIVGERRGIKKNQGNGVAENVEKRKKEEERIMAIELPRM